MSIIAVDTETTGLDFRHGVKPFLVTIAYEDNTQQYWEWPVNPYTRQPFIETKDLEEIQSEIDNAETVVFHNSKFDINALETIGIRVDWNTVHDTLFSAHLLESNARKSLSAQCLRWLDLDIYKAEHDLDNAVKKARNWCRTHYKDWWLSSLDDPNMPSNKQKAHKADMWLPQCVAEVEEYPKDHEWYTVCSTYANCDSACTLGLFLVHRLRMQEQGLEKLYEERRKLLPVTHKIEHNGLTLCKRRQRQLEKDYRKSIDRDSRTCINIARKHKYDLTIPKSGNNNSLREFVFDVLKLPVVKRTPKKQPSLDSSVLENYRATLEPRSLEKTFVDRLAAIRSRSTALNYMESYTKFTLPIEEQSNQWGVVYSSLNVVGTDTLRCASHNPNSQQISKKKDFNLRYIFGPAPGREWWSLDAKNIELRIPAYESGEPKMVEIFEAPDEPPYYGSYHLLIFSLLHPDKWNSKDPDSLKNCKEEYAATWYQWTKNGNFADQYNAGALTTDAAYHVPGGQKIVKSELPLREKLNKYWIDHAQRWGYVETLPDMTVDPNKGYPLKIKKNEWGRVKPTLPLNYHVQGTAMWVMLQGMVKVQSYLDELNPKTGFDGKIIAQVHDEILLDFPQKEDKGNLSIMMEIKEILDSIGYNLKPQIPIPFGISYHPNNWSEEEVIL